MGRARHEATREMATTAYSTVRIKVEDPGEALADQITDRQQEVRDRELRVSPIERI